MITLALGQILWGIAYRANESPAATTACGCLQRPRPFGIDITQRRQLLLLHVDRVRDRAVLHLAVLASPSAQPEGHARPAAPHGDARAQCLAGALDHLRHAGFWGSVAGMLFVYYNMFLSPHAIALQQSAEILLMAILGGTGTLAGPVVGAAIVMLLKNVRLGLRRALEHAARLDLRDRDRLHARRPGAGLPPAVAAHSAQNSTGVRPCASIRPEPAHDGARARKSRASASASAACPRPRTSRSTVMPGERRLIIGPNGAGKTTLFNLVTGDLTADSGSVKLFGQEMIGMRTPDRVQLGLARTYQILTLFPRETLLHNVVLSLLGLRSLRWNPWSILTGHRELYDTAQRGAGAGRPRRQRRARRGRDILWRAPAARARHGAGAEAEGAAARRAARRPLAGRARRPCAPCSTRSRAT